ncbi:MAG: M20/M25/M40 family metallo-hydrolase [Capsulimonadales bacterium]|nr:M20/M25/M40 family metallo-hydrolase [Capsulimonadales bacterium]
MKSLPEYRRIGIGLLVAAGVASSFRPAAWAQTPSAVSVATASAPVVSENLNTDMMARIREEGMNRSQVMSTLMYLTDVIGPRLTGSSQLKRANEWTRSKLVEWGLENAHLEPWGAFGRSWEMERFSAQVVQPSCIPLIALPKAWSPSTRGTVTRDVVYLDAADEAALEKYRGKLKDKIVLISPIRPVRANFTPQGNRWTDEALAEMSAPPGENADRPRRERSSFGGNMMQAMVLSRRKLQLCQQEGATAILETSRVGDGGTLFVQQLSVPPTGPQPTPGTAPPGPDAPRPISPWSKDLPKDTVPQIVVSAEHYNRLVRMTEAGEKVSIALELKARYVEEDKGMVFNTVAEIPGTDRKDEIVMCGGHIDSWHGATGATDNGAGVAVCMEAVRILKALGVRPRRTIRIALWSGEEQGLYGSRAYVAEHFGERKSGVLSVKPEHEKLSGYFNLDNGTGKIRGIYCQGNREIAPIFAEWLKPFHDLGATTVTLRNTGGTDHLPFDGVGLPGFQFIQDPVEYDTRTHHSNQDSFDRIQEDDMKQAATIMAAFLYNAAMRDEKLPRKPTAVAATP